MIVKETVDPNHANPLYTAEAVEFNEKSPAAQWVDASANADGVDLTSIRSARDVQILAQRVQDFDSAVSRVTDPDTSEPLVVYHGTAGSPDLVDARRCGIRMDRRPTEAMMNEHYSAKARKHWARWLPEKVAALRAEGMLEEALQTAGRAARDRVDELMEQGYQLHEAEEVALAEFILLKPEPKAALEPWERAELAASERAYQKMMR